MSLPSFEVVGYRLSRAVAARGIFFQTLEADRFQIAIDFRIENGRAARLELQYLPNGFERRAPGEWWHASQGFIQDGSKPVNVDGGGHRSGIAPRLFGGHVSRRADHRIGMCEAAVSLKEFGHPEISEMWFTLRIQEDVARFQ